MKLSVSDKQELKREQILNAAAKCVAYKGFHATSMADIARAAGIHPGHIYRYFENKEAIIKRIVEVSTEKELAWIASNYYNKNIAGIHIEHYFTDNSTNQALMLEILAEAARNPEIAEIVIDADKKMAAMAVASVRAIYPELDEEEAVARVEIMASLSESHLLRSIKKPRANQNLKNTLTEQVVDLLFPAK